MVKRLLLGALILAMSSFLPALAQSPCPITAVSSKLVCTIPQLYGPDGLGPPALQANTFHDVHFSASNQRDFTPLSGAVTSAVGTQLGLLELASPASGITFTFDRSLGIVQRSNQSFGPVLSERSETIGRHKLFLAVTYQYFNFSSIDGISLRNLPVVFQHVDTPGVNGCVAGFLPGSNNRRCNPVPVTLGPNGQPTFANDGNPTFELDNVVSNTSIGLKVHQITAFATYGLTNRIDVSVAVPFSNIRLGGFATSQIVANSVPIGDPNPLDYLHRACADAICLNPSFANVSTASGIGDVTLRVKGTVLRGERAGLAIGADLRTPTGDEMNFLGSGAVGAKPFVAASYRGRISPHANAGFEWNGKSILAGDIATGAKGRLPREFLYSAGVDVGVTRRLTVAADLLGTHVFNTFRVVPVTFTDRGNIEGQVHSYPDIFQVRDSLDMRDLGLGAKYSPFGNFLVTGNVQLKLNDAGLRAKAVPLIGLSYIF